jgi:hypothetical protein
MGELLDKPNRFFYIIPRWVLFGKADSLTGLPTAPDAMSERIQTFCLRQGCS